VIRISFKRIRFNNPWRFNVFVNQYPTGFGLWLHWRHRGYGLIIWTLDRRVKRKAKAQ